MSAWQIILEFVFDKAAQQRLQINGVPPDARLSGCHTTVWVLALGETSAGQAALIKARKYNLPSEVVVAESYVVSIAKTSLLKYLSNIRRGGAAYY